MKKFKLISLLTCVPTTAIVPVITTSCSKDDDNYELKTNLATHYEISNQETEKVITFAIFYGSNIETLDVNRSSIVLDQENIINANLYVQQSVTDMGVLQLQRVTPSSSGTVKLTLNIVTTNNHSTTVSDIVITVSAIQQ